MKKSKCILGALCILRQRLKEIHPSSRKHCLVCLITAFYSQHHTDSKITHFLSWVVVMKTPEASAALKQKQHYILYSTKQSY